MGNKFIKTFRYLLQYQQLYVMLCAIWYHLYNSKNVKNSKKVTLFHGCFSRFLNRTNGTKLHKASHITKFPHSARATRH